MHEMCNWLYYVLIFKLLMKELLPRLCILLLLFPLFTKGQFMVRGMGDGKVAVQDPCFYVDTSLAVNADSISTMYNQQRFQPLKGNAYRTGYDRAIHWIALQLTNNTGSVQELVYEIADPSIDELELFEKRGDSLQSLGLTGDIFPFSQRPVMDKDFVYEISLPQHSTKQYFLRLNSHGHTNYLTINVQAEPLFRHLSKREYLFWGMLNGVVLLVVLFSLFVFVSLRERFYALYALYVIVLLIWLLANSGLGFQYIWSSFPRLNNFIRFMAGTFSIVLMLTVMQQFLGQTKLNSRFYRFTNLLKWLLGIMVLLPLVPYDYSSNETLQGIFLLVADVLSLSCLVAVFGSCIEKLKQGIKTAAYYLSAVSAIAIGGVSIFMIRLKLIPANGFTLNLVYIGAVVEIVILTFGLTVRYNNYKKERIKLMLEMQEQEKEAAIKLALAKEEERRRIAADMHDDIGAGLSGLKLMSELATRKATADELKKETQRIASSASDLSDKMRDIIWTLNTENDTLQKLLFYIHHYGDQLFETAEMRFNMQLPSHIPSIAISGDWRRHVFLAIKEAFNNIIKHSGASSVQCTVEIGLELSILVSDNGKGFATSEKYMGNGLVNMHHRMKEVNGKLDINSTHGASLLFRVPLPNP